MNLLYFVHPERMEPSAMEEMLNKKLDEYRIVDILGKGGMGIVYKAFDENLRKYVALKMMNPMLARDDKFMKRFDKEAQSQAQLDHRNIVRVYTFRKTDGLGFIVMELIQGRTLANMMLLKQPIPWQEAMPVFKQSLEALIHAHNQNVVHRDIKPGNIMITDDNQVKVTDFGLAKIQAGAHTTVSETTAGTLRYMSPEQVKGDRNLDHRSDLYSLGITFYEMLTGDLPIGKGTNDYQVYKEILEKELPSPLELNSDIPESLAKIILKSTQKDPAKRYQTARAMLDDLIAFEILQRANPGETVLLNRETGVQNAGEKKSNVPIFAAGGVLIAALLGVLFWMNSSAPADTVSLLSTPSAAEVYFDGRFVGETPLTDYPLKAVAGTVTLKKEGYETLDTLLSEEEGLPAEINFRLAPAITDPSDVLPVASGNLDLVSHPSGAMVLIDGVSKGVTPLVLKNLIPGEHRVRFRLEGFEDREILVDLNEGQTRSMDITLNELAAEKPVEKAAGNAQAASANSTRELQLADTAKDKLSTAKRSALNAGAGKLTDFIRADELTDRANTAYRRKDYDTARRGFNSAARLYGSAESEALRLAERNRKTDSPPEKSEKPKEDPLKAEALNSQQRLNQVSGALDPSYHYLSPYKDAARQQQEAEQMLASGSYADAASRFQLAENNYRLAVNMRKAQETAVQNVVESYRLALENKNIEALRNLHPTLDSRSENNWKDFFDYVKNLRVTTQVLDTRFIETGARIRARIRFDYDGAKNNDWNNWEFIMQESNSRWLVQEISR